jgi:serine/threonine-protein kinase
MTPSITLKIGARIGGYVIRAPLGVGGMGRVFLAEDDQLARKVALKILPPEESDEEGRARFLREAQALARVQHKNVVQVFASGVDEDVAWMALEYVEGEPFSALVNGTQGVDEETALSLCSQAARGLAAVHEVGVVHRDVKPDNLLLDDNANVRVLDFGVALFTDGLKSGGFVTQKGVAVGTPHFMAPEQARGGTLDARTDAWGLGCTLFAMLAGRPPFFAKDDEPDLDILARVLRDRAPDVNTRLRAGAVPVSGATAALIGRLLDPDVDTRLGDMAAIADSCDDIADGVARGDAPPSPVSQAPAPSPASEPLSPLPSAPVAVRPSILSVVAVALLFAGLGALVAGQIAQRVVDESPPTVLDLPPPTAPVVPAPPSAEGPTTEGNAPPTAEELEALVMFDPGTRGPLWELMGRSDDAARAAVARLAGLPGSLGDVALDAVVASRSRDHLSALEAALMQPDRVRADKAIQALTALRPFEALGMLDKAARSHEDKVTRARALAARQQLFRVDGD